MGWFCEGPSTESAKSHHRNLTVRRLRGAMDTEASFEARCRTTVLADPIDFQGLFSLAS